MSAPDDPKHMEGPGMPEGGAQSNGGAAALAPQDVDHKLAVGQTFNTLDELKVQLQEYAHHHGFYVNISTELASAGRTPRLRARCNRAGKPPSSYVNVPEDKKRRRTSLKVGCSWELVAHVCKDTEGGGGAVWKVTSFDPQHCELCRPGVAQMELIGNHKRRKRHSLRTSGAPDTPTAPGSPDPTPSPAGAAAAAAAAASGGSGSTPATPSLGSAAAAAAAATGGGGASMDRSMNVSVLPEGPSMLNGSPLVPIVRSEESVPAPRRRRRELQQAFSDIANLACLTEHTTDLVHSLLAGLLAELREPDEMTLPELYARLAMPSAQAGPAATPPSTSRPISRHCSFCNAEAHTARSCPIKKSLGILLTFHDIDYSPLPPIAAYAPSPPLPLIEFIPSHLCAVQLRATVPATLFERPRLEEGEEMGPAHAHLAAVAAAAMSAAAAVGGSPQPFFVAALYNLTDMQNGNVDVPLRLVTWPALLAWSNEFKSANRCVFIAVHHNPAHSLGPAALVAAAAAAEQDGAHGPLDLAQSHATAGPHPQPHSHSLVGSAVNGDAMAEGGAGGGRAGDGAADSEMHGPAPAPSASSTAASSSVPLPAPAATHDAPAVVSVSTRLRSTAAAALANGSLGPTTPK